MAFLVSHRRHDIAYREPDLGGVPMINRLLAVVTLLFAFAAATSPAEAAARSISLKPSAGQPGTKVTVTGRGFQHQQCAGYATVAWEGKVTTEWIPLAENNADPSFVTTVVVPQNAKPSNIKLTSTCGAGELQSPGPSAFFTVQPPPITPTPTTSVTTTTSHTTTTTTATTSTATTTTPTSTSGQPTDPTTTIATTTPTATPGASKAANFGQNQETDGDAKVLPVRMTTSLPTANAMQLSTEVLIAAGLLAALLILLIAFPAELFNKTYEHNKDEIHRALGKIGLRRLEFPRWLGLASLVLIGGALSAILAHDEGPSGNPVAHVIGFVVAVPVVIFAYGMPKEWFTRNRTGAYGFVSILPMALVVAVLCSGLSLLLGLKPPYLYGLFAGFVAMRERRQSPAGEGFGVLLGVLCLMSIGILAWLAWNPVHASAHGPDPTWPAVVADAILFWVFVLGAESLVFALPPARFLDGAKLRDWHTVFWLIPQIAAAGLFVYVFMLRGQLDPPDGGWAAVVKAFVFFLIFGGLSVLFWSYFKWDNRPTRRWAQAGVPRPW
jgi:hypothetical protein